jgi:hypothetical protein
MVGQKEIGMRGLWTSFERLAETTWAAGQSETENILRKGLARKQCSGDCVRVLLMTGSRSIRLVSNV